MTGNPAWMPGITAAVAIVIVVALLARAQGTGTRVLLAFALAAIVVSWQREPALLLFLPPAAINVAMGLIFATTLRRGGEPLISRYARAERGGGALPADLARYTRRLTVVWSTYFFLAAAVGVLLAVFAPLAVWSTFANVVSYVLVAVLFVGEHAFRTRRFAHYDHASLLRLLRTVVRERPLRPHA